jgi:hypothetical protein
MIMDRSFAPSSIHVGVTPEEIVERMRRVDGLVRPWFDPAFRAQIDPDVPEVVGPPTRTPSRRIRRRI